MQQSTILGYQCLPYHGLCGGTAFLQRRLSSSPFTTSNNLGHLFIFFFLKWGVCAIDRVLIAHGWNESCCLFRRVCPDGKDTPTLWPSTHAYYSSCWQHSSCDAGMEYKRVILIVIFRAHAHMIHFLHGHHWHFWSNTDAHLSTSSSHWTIPTIGWFSLFMVPYIRNLDRTRSSSVTYYWLISTVLMCNQHVLLNSKVEIHNYWKMCLHVEYNIRLFNAIFPKARSPRIYLYFARKQVQWFITTSSNINGNPICKETHSTILTSLKISVWYDRCYYSAQHELSFL